MIYFQGMFDPFESLHTRETFQTRLQALRGAHPSVADQRAPLFGRLAGDWNMEKSLIYMSLWWFIWISGDFLWTLMNKTWNMVNFVWIYSVLKLETWRFNGISWDKIEGCPKPCGYQHWKEYDGSNRIQHRLIKQE